MIKVVG